MAIGEPKLMSFANNNSIFIQLFSLRITENVPIFNWEAVKFIIIHAT